nr:hypothetical protein [Tanacetum cinerariifolium]
MEQQSCIRLIVCGTLNVRTCVAKEYMSKNFGKSGGRYMKTFRKSICVKIKEEVEFIEGEVEFALALHIPVKERQEKDKIRSKPDRKREAWRSPEKSKPVTVKKEIKNKENTSSKDQRYKS